jgi:hypothetical protein
VGKGGRRVYVVKKSCIHVCKCTNDNCCCEGIKESGGGDEFKYDIDDTF